MMTKDDRNGVVYAALGDSTGVGVGAKDGGYVARLFGRIRRELPASRLINLCISGATTGDLLREQLDAAVKASPELVTLGIGINDLGRGVSTRVFAANFEEIVHRVRTATAAAVVISNIPDLSLAPVVPVYMRDAARHRVLEFNENVGETARGHGLPVVDAYSATPDQIPAHPEFFSSDGFHPSDAGYEYWADVMWPTVRNAMGKKVRL
jgi:acyl-CoA thioesterase-1